MKKTTLITITTAMLALCACSPHESSEERKIYTLSFDSQYGIVDSIQVEFGHTLANLPAVPERTGYEGYWTIDDVIINTDTVYNFHENKTAIAKYDALEYLLTFDGTSSVKKIKYNEKIGDLPAIPEKTGYVAATGWTIDNEAINSDSIYKWVSNKIAKVDYEVKKYKLSFEGLTTINEYAYGDVLGELPAVPTDEDKPTSKYEYNWMIDDEIINSTTIYSYYVDKEAKRSIRKIDPYDCVVDSNIVNANVKKISEYVVEKDGHVQIDTDGIQAMVDNKVIDTSNSGVSISWTYKEGFNFEYDYNVVEISKDKEFASADDIISIVTFTDNIETEAILETGTTYYYRIKSYKTNASNERELVEESNVKNFTTSSGARTLQDPSSVMDNLRDALSYPTALEGKKLKQGIVYRSANFDKANADTKVFAKEILGIKTDLDLRNEEERSSLGNASPLGSNVAYKYVSRTEGGVCYYGGQANGTGINETATTSNVSGVSTLREELLTFADSGAYPMVFHCAIGRDRTGTLNAILLALAGVNEVDIYRDYFTSVLSQSGQRDGSAVSALSENITSVIQKLIDQQDGKNTQEKITNYLIDNKVLSQTEINQIVSNILEDK